MSSCLVNPQHRLELAVQIQKRMKANYSNHNEALSPSPHVEAAALSTPLFHANTANSPSTPSELNFSSLSVNSSSSNHGELADNHRQRSLSVNPRLISYHNTTHSPLLHSINNNSHHNRVHSAARQLPEPVKIPMNSPAQPVASAANHQKRGISSLTLDNPLVSARVLKFDGEVNKSLNFISIAAEAAVNSPLASPTLPSFTHLHNNQFFSTSTNCTTSVGSSNSSYSELASPVSFISRSASSRANEQDPHLNNHSNLTHYFSNSIRCSPQASPTEAELSGYNANNCLDSDLEEEEEYSFVKTPLTNSSVNEHSLTITNLSPLPPSQLNKSFSGLSSPSLRFLKPLYSNSLLQSDNPLAIRRSSSALGLIHGSISPSKPYFCRSVSVTPVNIDPTHNNSIAANNEFNFEVPAAISSLKRSHTAAAANTMDIPAMNGFTDLLNSLNSQSEGSKSARSRLHSNSSRAQPYGHENRANTPKPTSNRINRLTRKGFSAAPRHNSDRLSPLNATISNCSSLATMHSSSEVPYHKPKLPVLEQSKAIEGCNTVSCETVAKLLNNDNELQSLYSQIIIIDCRYPYEYAGGHIRCAVSSQHNHYINETLLSNPSAMTGGDSTSVCLIFHCEFSQQRGPASCRYLRSRDRQMHGVAGFPNLYYSELYAMAGGYKEFYQKFPELCEPQSYVPQNDPRFLQDEKACKALSKSRSMSQINVASSAESSASSSGISSRHFSRSSSQLSLLNHNSIFFTEAALPANLFPDSSSNMQLESNVS
jgi:rhodanese-related sulfurtransferase